MSPNFSCVQYWKGILAFIGRVQGSEDRMLQTRSGLTTATGLLDFEIFPLKSFFVNLVAATHLA